MDNDMVGIYLPFLITTTIIFFLDFGRYSRTGRGGSFTFMCLGVIGWIATSMGIISFTDGGSFHLISSNMLIMFMNYTLSAQFLFSYWFFRTDYRLPTYVPVLIYLIPNIFTFAALSPLYYMIVDIYHMIVEEVPVSVPAIENRIAGWDWFVFVSSVYSYVMVIATITIVIVGYIKRPKYYKLPSMLILIASVLTIASVFAFIFDFQPGGLNPMIATMAVVLVMSRIAISIHSKSLYARQARLDAFDLFGGFIVIYGKGGQIADYNRGAARWFSNFGVNLGKITIEDALAALKEKGAQIKDAPNTSDDPTENTGIDIWTTHKGFSHIYNMQTYDMLDEKDRIVGTVAFFFDVTQNREMLDTLEKKAGVDPLSGIPNRLAFDGAKVRYDELGHLPLSVIMCDLNGLKSVNDNLGHKYGDLLIQTCSEIVEEACKKPNFVARIGGDEFVFILSQTSEQKANAFIEQLLKLMETRSENLPFRVMMAMGAATKYDMDESLEDIIAEADQKMYENKKIMKAKGIPIVKGVMTVTVDDRL